MKENFKNVVLVKYGPVYLCAQVSVIHEMIYLGCSLLALQMPWLGFEVAGLHLGHESISGTILCVFFKCWHGSSFRAGSVLQKLEAASEDQNRELASGTATGPHKEAVWC